MADFGDQGLFAASPTLGQPVAPLDRLVAIEAIKHVKARYFRYVDQQDWKSYSTIFRPEAHFELGAGTFAGSAVMIEHVSGLLQGGTTFHYGHMPEIDILGPDDATAVWTLFDVVELPAEAGRPPFEGYARYWERYRREDGEWKIAWLRIERLRIVETEGR